MGSKGSKKTGAADDKETIEICECDKEEFDDPRNCLLSSCDKNPGHDKFIPVNELKLEHLPPDLQHESILNYILAHEKLVVKIKMSTLSPNRSVTDETAQYRSATGYAWCTDDRLEMKCERPKCDCEPLNTVFGGIVIYTNHHVAFDESEAKNSEIQFFYNYAEDSDKDNVPVNEKMPVQKAYGYNLRECNSNKDLVGIQVYFHDRTLYDRVSQFSSGVSKAWDQVPNHFKENFKKHAIVISHPHGAVKLVTFGELLALEEEQVTGAATENSSVSNSSVVSSKSKTDLRKVTQYNAQTCPGSSGAPVLTGYYHNPERPFTHSRSHANSSVNFSVSF